MARCARPARLAVRLLRQNPRKLYGKPALVSSLSRLGSLLGGGRSLVRTGAIPQREVLASMELFAKEVIPEFRE